MEKREFIKANELAENPTPRVPICLCLDTSASMNIPTGEGYETRIQALQKGVESLIRELNEDEIARYSAELSVLTFNDRTKCLMEFTNISKVRAFPTMQASGMTNMGEAVNRGLDMLEEEKERYRSQGVDYYQPWLIIMTDGMPNGRVDELERAFERTSRMVRARKLVVIAVGIGKDAGMQCLDRFSPSLPAMRLKGMRFREFFAWISSSIKQVSQSMPGEELVLTEPDCIDWNEIGR